MPRTSAAAKRGKKPIPVAVAVGLGALVLPRRKRVAKPATTPTPPAAAAGLASTPEERRALQGYARDNPADLCGQALRDLAHERGMSRSEVNTMTDDKVREQLRYKVSADYGA